MPVIPEAKEEVDTKAEINGYDGEKECKHLGTSLLKIYYGPGEIRTHNGFWPTDFKSAEYACSSTGPKIETPPMGFEPMIFRLKT